MGASSLQIAVILGVVACSAPPQPLAVPVAPPPPVIVETPIEPPPPPEAPRWPVAWTYLGGGSGAGYGRGVALRDDGSLAVAGPEHVAAFTAAGALAFATGLGKSGGADSVAMLPDGGIVACGLYQGVLSIAGKKRGTAKGAEDLYVAAFEADGRVRWVTTAGAKGADRCSSIAALADGSLVIGGWFEKTVAFGKAKLAAVGGVDGFVAKLSPTGAWEWARPVASPERDWVRTVAVLGGAIYVAGELGVEAAVFVARYELDGALAWTASTPGRVGAEIGPFLGLLDDTTIAVASTLGDDGGELARFTPTGEAGMTTNLIGSPSSFVVLPDRRFVIASVARTREPVVTTLAHYGPSGMHLGSSQLDAIGITDVRATAAGRLALTGWISGNALIHAGDLIAADKPIEQPSAQDLVIVVLDPPVVAPVVAP